jgi:hypothetical protein
MSMKAWLYRSICRVLALTMLALSVPEPARAGLITTQQAVTAESSRADHERIRALLARGEVRSQLAALGVSPADAAARADALGDDEVRDLAARMDALPAGGDGGILLVLVLVLLIVVLLRTR